MPSKWIVAATGPSLSKEIADKCVGQEVVAVNDAYRLFPYARILYAADAQWWDAHKGVPGFFGEKWITVNDHCFGLNIAAARKYRLQMIPSERRRQGFSTDPDFIHLGGNSGFQAVNIALLRGARTVVLVGFDMQGTHFFGEHPPFPRRGPNGDKGFRRWIKAFTIASEMMPDGVRIINATPNSALTCFPMMSLEEALRA